jgi:hypothetical protein
MKKIIVFLLLAFLLSCQTYHKEKVHCYKVRITNTYTDDWLYYYLITSSDSYYYTSSSTPITNFSTASWQTSKTNPLEEITEKEELPEEELTTEELPEELQSEIETAEDLNDATVDENSTDVESSDASDGGDGGDGGGDGGDGGGD